MSLISRRRLLGAAASSTIAAGLTDPLAARAQGTGNKTLRILDVIGNLPLTELGLELYTKEHPDSFNRLKFDEAPASKIEDIIKKAVEIPGTLPDLIMVGIDRMVEGSRDGLWQELLPKFASHLPDLRAVYAPRAWDMQNYADGHGLVLSYFVTGPVLARSASSALPATLKASDLPDWTRANPGRFGYARPTTSRSGRDFLMSLPYLLGDTAPSDPVNGWERTWSFLANIGTRIGDYPLSVKPLITGLETGSLDLTLCTFGEIFAARATAKSALRIGAFDDSHWINEAQFAAIPKQVTLQRTLAIVDVLDFMLGQEAQAFALRQGSLFPGSAIADVSVAPPDPSLPESTRAADSKDFTALTESGRFVPPLFGAALQYALARWDRQIRLKQ